MVTSRPASIDDLAERILPEHWELVKGEILEVTPASGRSSRIGGRIYALFLRHGEEQGLGWAFPADSGFILFPDRQTVRSPDAAFVLRHRLAGEPEGFVPVVPDIAVEVLSPSDRLPDAFAKVAMYLQAGVQIVWLVNPSNRTVVVFRPDEDPLTLSQGDELTGGEILPDLLVPVAEIFN